jgi:hypothetical protein
MKRESKRFFFEKKKQKTFIGWVWGAEGATAPDPHKKLFEPA